MKKPGSKLTYKLSWYRAMREIVFGLVQQFRREAELLRD